MSDWKITGHFDFISAFAIRPSHADGSNIALRGFCDLPARIGTTYHEWDEEDGIEPFVTVDEIMFEGRDLSMHCIVIDTRYNIDEAIDQLNTEFKDFTDLEELATPYGNFQVLIKNVTPDYLALGARLVINFREPVVTLTGGSLPVTGAANNKIDGIPFESFGLYLSSIKDARQLPDMKDHSVTKYGSEGYYVAKRKNVTLTINGFVVGSSLSDFQSKIRALYLVFKSAGLRTIVMRTTTVTCFAANGFKVDNIHVSTNQVIANFSIQLIVVTIT